ncbi:hypothetical protein F4818DRAFT_423330 [Hypoxylon cercidicola]|nr:hypothetical protein F4818DRAFT_423330 [Hypoxylon cercidicola]
MLPYESKIRFTGTTIVPYNYRKRGAVSSILTSIWYQGDHTVKGWYYEVRSAFACVDLERDLFYFDYQRYKQYGREWFRFLRNPITGDRPRKLPEDHWIFSVRNVALYIPFSDILISECDETVLSGMKLLQNVYLVVPENPILHGGTSTANMQVWPVSTKLTWEPHKTFKFAEEFPIRGISFPQEHGRGIEKDLRDLFTKHGINPRLRVCVESDS